MTFSGRNLTCMRGERFVFRAIDFDLRGGDALVVRGPNGSGKSSLLRLAAGLLPAADGELVRDGRAVAEDPDRHRASLHHLGHLDAVKTALSVRENLLLWSRLLGADASHRERPAIDDALATVDLLHVADLPTRYLSAGQRRRLALSRLVAIRRPLWILDEPTASLDDAGVAALAELLRGHREMGGMAILAVHGAFDVPEAAVLALRPIGNTGSAQ